MGQVAVVVVAQGKGLEGPAAHFGLINSSICPPVVARVALYLTRSYISPLIEPGYGEKPVASSLTSPAAWPLASSSGSSWLYSTLHTILRPSACVSWQTAPMASLAFRGTETMLTATSRCAVTPSVARKCAK